MFALWCIGAVELLYWCCQIVKHFVLTKFVFDSACPVHVSGWWMPLINGIVVRLRFLILILICTYGYLSLFGITRNWYFIFYLQNISLLCVSSASAWWWFCFCLKDYELINEIVFPVYTYAIVSFSYPIHML